MAQIYSAWYTEVHTCTYKAKSMARDPLWWPLTYVFWLRIFDEILLWPWKPKLEWLHVSCDRIRSSFELIWGLQLELPVIVPSLASVRPKPISEILAPALFRRMLGLLMSRCKILWLCRYVRPFATSKAMLLPLQSRQILLDWESCRRVRLWWSSPSNIKCSTRRNLHQMPSCPQVTHLIQLADVLGIHIASIASYQLWGNLRESKSSCRRRATSSVDFHLYLDFICQDVFKWCNHW